MLGYSIEATGANSTQAAEEALDKVGIGRNSLAMIISTGYSRISVPFADKKVTEIFCHRKGACHLFLEVGLIPLNPFL